MITRLFSSALRWVEGQEVEVEVNARGADKAMAIIVGKRDLANNPLIVNVLHFHLGCPQVEKNAGNIANEQGKGRIQEVDYHAAPMQTIWGSFASTKHSN